MNLKVVIVLVFLVVLFGCSEHRQDPRLEGIEDYVLESPNDALLYLDSIDYNTLSFADQQYYDLLKVKATDKAYIKHKSDSTILRVIKYYSTHDSNNLYSEALYLGGRVYCDLGDYPTALQYFHKALNSLPESNIDLNKKANLLSQTGRLLTELSLYKEAIPYIRESIKIGKTLNDTVNIVYDLQLLGGTYLRAKEYRLAEECFNTALRLSLHLPVSFTAKSKMYLAAVKYETGQLDSALNLIRNTEKQVKSVARNSALAYSSKIYLHKNILDSAYIYAYDLIHSHDSTHMEVGYQVMLSPELRPIISSDSINQYISDYRQLLESYYDSNKSQLTINQQNFYNYQIHERARRRAEIFNSKLTRVLICSFFVILILAVIVLYYKNRSKKNLIELHIALDNLRKIKSNIEPSQSSHIIYSDDSIPDKSEIAVLIEPHVDNDQSQNLLATSQNSLKESTELRERLRNELLNLYKSNPKVSLSQTIVDSSAFNELQNRIKDNQVLSYEDPLWDELEETVIKASPNFKKNLQLLTQSRLTSIDLHTALLIKCQINPTSMTILLSKSKGAIVSRRESLCFKIFDKKLGTRVIDGIIRLL